MKQTDRSLTIFFLCFTLVTSILRAESIDPKNGEADPDGWTMWYDCKLLTIEGKGWTNTESYYDRLPAKAKDTVPGAVWDLGHDTAGMCARFVTDAQYIKIRWTLLNETLAMPHMPATGVSGVDLYAKDETGKWYFVGNGRPEAVSNEAFFELAEGKTEYMLYLPLYNGVKSVEFGIPKNKTISKPIAPSRKQDKTIVFYGTSITQGACASRPGMASTAIVGRQLAVPIINLGFSAAGEMEPEMADLLAELDPAVYVLDCLPNMSPGMVSQRIEPFVKKLRRARSDTPIILVEDTNFRDITPTLKGRVLRAVHEELITQGITDLHLVPNEGMLGKDLEGTVDGCHPNDLGMMRQAAVFMKSLAPILQESQRQRSDK
jgi:hypothetical protein